MPERADATTVMADLRALSLLPMIARRYRFVNPLVSEQPTVIPTQSIESISETSSCGPFTRIPPAVVAQFLFNPPHPTRLAVQGNSMFPVLRSGDSVDVKPFVAPLFPGRVYAYIRFADGIMIAHRYVGRRGGVHFFWGDRNLVCEKVDESAVVGECVVRENPIRKALKSLVNRIGCRFPRILSGSVRLRIIGLASRGQRLELWMQRRLPFARHA